MAFGLPAAKRQKVSANSSSAPDIDLSADFIAFDIDPDPPPSIPTGPRASALGKRKRNDTTLVSTARGSYHTDGQILASWRPSNPAEISSSPWLESATQKSKGLSRLHREVVDFYTWVRPQDFEQTVRQDLVTRLHKELNRFRPGGTLKAFGSFATGLYLPTGDMDLVYNTGNDVLSKSKFWQFCDFLKFKSNIPSEGSVFGIAKARVPIIKFVDAMTGLRVDLSFNNNTGVQAIETFNKWKKTYPAMPVLVLIIKHYLMIRGLHDNANGGFGGTATICMVTSLIQHLPTEKRHTNLGDLLLSFFALYGTVLNYRDVGIRMEPPGFVLKNQYPPLPNEKSDRLMVIDPNRPDNNITGGSSQAERIFRLNQNTHATLSGFLNDPSGAPQSYLREILGVTFDAYEKQRQKMLEVYQSLSHNHNSMVSVQIHSSDTKKKSAKRSKGAN